VRGVVILPAVTIIGIWQEKFKKFRLIRQVFCLAGIVGRKVLNVFGVVKVF
jgi:hypothetical protein